MQWTALVIGEISVAIVPEDLNLVILLLVLIRALILGKLTHMSLLNRLAVHLAIFITVGLMEELIYMRLLEHLRRLGMLRPIPSLPVLSTLFTAWCT